VPPPPPENVAVYEAFASDEHRGVRMRIRIPARRSSIA
jgi:hypothetical protein